MEHNLFLYPVLLFSVVLLLNLQLPCYILPLADYQDSLFDGWAEWERDCKVPRRQYSP